MSNILTRLFKQPQTIETRTTAKELLENNYNPVLGYLSFLNSSNYAESKALKLSSVYRAVNVISDSVAILELIPYEYKDNWKYKQVNDLYYLLNVQPNNLMSAHIFKKLLVQNVLLKGNCYIHIIRNQDFSAKELIMLNSDMINIVSVDNQIKYLNKLTNETYDSSDIIHIMNYSNNGLIGISTLSYASMSLETAYNSEQHASNFFSGGGALSGILKPLAGVNLTKDKALSAKASLIDSLNNSGLGKSNSIVVLDSGLDYQPISISPKDSQLLESRQFNFISIAQFFGVPLSKLFEKTGQSYASAEAEQIDFLNSTLLPLLEKIELEFFRKLYLKVDYDKSELKFDVETLLRLDSTAKASYFSQLFNMGALSVNEIREKTNANYPIVNGNRHFVQQNVQPIDNLLNDIKNQNTDNLTVISGTTVNEDIQKTALNGAQITSLVEVINNIALGILAKESAKQIISAAFPSFTTDQINGIVDPIEIKKDNNIQDNNKDNGNQ